MRMQNKWAGSLVGIIVALLLAACSSGGDGDATSPPPPVASPAEGLWTGTSSSGGSVAGLVLNDGTYWFLYSKVGNPNVIAGVVQGTGSSQAGSFTSSNTKEFSLGIGILDATLAGSYVMKQSISGIITRAVGGQFTFNSTYNADYDLIPDVNLLVGTYTGSTATAGVTELVTVTLSSPNLIAGSSPSGCDFTGTFVPRSSGNVYDVSVTFAGGVCSNGTSTVTGIAFFDAGTMTLYSAALNSTRTDGFIFLGSKL